MSRPDLDELRVGDNRHHIACRRCDAIADGDCAAGDASDYQYEIDDAEVSRWGRCPECVAATSVSSDELEQTPSV